MMEPSAAKTGLDQEVTEAFPENSKASLEEMEAAVSTIKKIRTRWRPWIWRNSEVTEVTVKQQKLQTVVKVKVVL